MKKEQLIVFVGALMIAAWLPMSARAVNPLIPLMDEQHQEILGSTTPTWGQQLDSTNGDTNPDRAGCDSDRFACGMNDQAVRDNETGLVWERFPTGPSGDWNFARSKCTDLTTGGRKGWRLPSVHELASLVDPSVTMPGPLVPVGHPFGRVQILGFYWSATTDADNPANAWGVLFRDGRVQSNGKHFAGLDVWCVRGSMNADAY